MEGTQPCYNCNLYFCFCKNSIKIHKLLDEKSLYCNEKIEDSPKRKSSDDDGPSTKKRKVN